MEPNQIPLDLNLLRYVEGDPENDALVTYDIDALNTNFVRPCFAIMPRDSDDIAGAIEETLHLLLENNSTPDDVYRILGLLFEEELDEDMRADGDYTPIDLGYCIPGNMVSFAVISEEDASLSHVLSDKQVLHFLRAMDTHHVPFSDAMRLTKHDYDAWQASAICQAVASGLSKETIDALSDPAFSSAQMVALTAIAKEGAAIRPYLDPAISAPRMQAICQAIRLGGSSLPLPSLSLDQLRTLSPILKERTFSMETLASFARPEFSSDSMALLADALNGKKEEGIPALSAEEASRILSPAYTAPQQVVLLSAMESGTPSSALSKEAWSTLFSPDFAPDKLRAITYALNENQLSFARVADILEVAKDADATQLLVLFDAEADPYLPTEAVDILVENHHLPAENLTLLAVKARYGCAPEVLQEEAAAFASKAPSTKGSLQAEAIAMQEGKDALSQDGKTDAPSRTSYEEEK